MDCEHFERWLDDGLPETDPSAAAVAAAARAHAATCARCAAALAGARALEAALEPSAVVAPAGFAAGVMERVARARMARGLAWIESDALPWWVRAAAEPATALSLALAALVLWQYPALARLTAVALEALVSPAVAPLLRGLAEPPGVIAFSTFSDPAVALGLALAMLPLAWWAGFAAYHWSGDPQRSGAARR